MLLPSDLRTSLPSSIDPERVRAAVRSSGSPGSLGGETWLLDLDGGLAVLVRSSIFDTLEPLALSDDGRPPVTLAAGPELTIRPATGSPFVVRPSMLEVDAVEALLAAIDQPAALPPVTASEARPSALVEPAPPLDDHEPARAPHDPVTLADDEVIDPDLESAASEAIAAGDDDRAIAVARELARASGPRERDAWNDLAEVLTRLRSGEVVAAYLWTRGVREIPISVTDPVFARLHHELERRDELALAWAALGGLLVDDSGPERRGHIEERLGVDGPTLAREVAGRARDFFLGPAKGGDRLAQRGLAQALLELDELGEALTWIRRATAAERFDFGARMLETQILALRAIEIDDDRELLAALQKAADDFHDRPEPLVDLADHVEYDDPQWAIESLRKAQDRRFDEFVVLDLVELLDSQGRHAEAMRELEQALADPEAVELVEDQLREKLDAVRAKLALGPAAKAELTSPSPAPKPNLVLVAVVIVLFAIGLILAM